jgi:chromosome segregation ATPase
MAARRKTGRTQAKPVESSIGVGDVALIASILGNLKFHGEKEELRHTVEALQRMVQDWQVAYQTLDAQLAFALRTIEDQNRLLGTLREQLKRTQTRAAEAEARALRTEAEHNRPARGRRPLSLDHRRLAPPTGRAGP